MASTFRKLIRFMGPKWLVGDKVDNPDGTQTETDSRILYPLMLMFDAFTDRLRLGIRARMIGFAPADARSYIGQGLDIPIGPAEADAAYEARLTSGIDDKRIAGAYQAILKQIAGYCSPYAVRVRLVNERGTWYTRERDGTFSIVTGTAWDWDGKSVLARRGIAGPGLPITPPFSQGGTTRVPWSRFWVLIYPTTDVPKKPWDRDGTWGDGLEVWGNSTTQTWGSTASPDDVTAIRRIVQRWKPAGTHCMHILIVFNDTSFAPTDTSPPNADGKWESDGKYDSATPGRKVPARNANAIYWRGSS